MDSVHNPDRFMADLRQVLSQGRKRIGLLVGAGAPLSIKIDANGKLSPAGQALIPDVDALMTKVLVTLEGMEQSAAMAIHAGLGTQANVEALLSKVRLLEQALSKTLVHGLDGEGYANLGRSICKVIGGLVGPKLPAERKPITSLSPGSAERCAATP